jgi:hypothetical protein
VCFVVVKTTSELECMILTTLYLVGAKTMIVGKPRRVICSVFFLFMFRWFPHLRSPSLPMMIL